MSIYKDIKTGLEQAIVYETMCNKSSMSDCLTVTYDLSLPDSPTLCIGRISGDNVSVLNILHGDEAFGIYHYLTGGAYLTINDVAKKPVGDLHSVPHYRCPTCNGAVVMYCDDHHYPCCQWCGQKLDWN